MRIQPVNYSYYRSVTLLFNLLVAVSSLYSQNWVTQVSPTRNLSQAPDSTLLQISLNRKIDPATIADTSIIVIGSMGGRHTGTVLYDSATMTLTFSPATRFFPGEVVTATMKRGIVSAAGDTLKSSFSWSFTVKANSASRVFTDFTAVGAGGTLTSHLLADVDNNGSADFMLTNADSLLVWTSQSTSPSFTLHSNAVGSYADALAAGDFDGDGHIDLVVGRRDASTITVFHNDGNGSFSPAQTMTVTPTQSLVVADFDGDGNQDIACSQLNASVVTILRGNGDCTFQNAGSIQNSTIILQILAGDFNGDGGPDIMLVTSSNNVLCKNDGNLSFSLSIASFFNLNPTEVFVGDFDNDGILDLLGYQKDTYQLQISKGALNGGFVGPYTVSLPYVVTSSLQGVASGDVDGDGKLDILLSASVGGSNVVTVLQNTGQMTFAGAEQRTSPLFSGRLLAGDFTGDGRIDVALEFGSTEIAFYRNSAAFPLSSVSVASFDFGTVPIDSSRSQVAYLRNSGTGPLHVSSIQTSSPAFFAQLGVSTINPGDSTSLTVTFNSSEFKEFDDSLFISSDDPARSLISVPVHAKTSIVRSVFPKAFANSVADTSSIEIRFARQLDAASVNDSVVSVVGSLGSRYSGHSTYDDADRTIRVVASEKLRIGDQVTVLLKKGIRTALNDSIPPYSWTFTVSPLGGSGKFSVSQSVVLGNVGTKPAVGDFNHDGRPDIAYSDYRNGNVVIAENQGGMIFTRKTFAAGSKPTVLTAADYDGDGIVDLAVVNAGPLTVTILKGNPDGTFTTAATIETGVGVSSISSGDIDGDGRPDLVLSCFSPSGLTILKNNGLFDFQPALQLPFTYAPSPATLCDFDSDGELDIAVVVTYEGSLRLYEHTKGFEFNQRSMPFPWWPPVNMLCADFDNDGNADIAVLGLDAVWILHNKGMFHFSGPDQVASVGSGGSFVAADFDRDGYLDMAVTLTSASYFSFLRNNGNLSFTNSEISGTGEYLPAIAAADFDNDGDIDVSLVTRYDSVLTIQANKNATPTILLPKKSYDFRTVRMDTVKAMQMEVVNDGTVQPLVVSSIAASDSAFTISPQSHSIAAGDTFRFTISFRPQTPKVFIDSLSIASNDSTKPVFRVSVRGIGDQIRSMNPFPYSGGATDTSPVIIDFTLDLDPESVSDSTVRVSGEWTGLHKSAGLGYNTAARRLTYTPEHAFLPGEEVTVALTAGLRRLAGQGDFLPRVWSYKAKPRLSTGILRQKVQLPVPAAPMGITAADFDGDGDLDLAVVCHDADSLVILRNDGHWSFTPVFKLQLGAGPSKVLAGDYDGDGKLDLVVTDIASRIDFYRNNGNFDFTRIELATPGYIEFLSQADLDGDGDLDFVCASSSSDGSYNIVRNNGHFTFTVFTYTLATYLRGLVTGDFEGDGTIDIGIVDRVLRNEGNFSFTVFPSVLPGVSLDSWDFDGDGREDLIGGSYGIMHNRGDMTFELSLSSGFSVGSLAVGADDDGDGVEDVTSLSENSLTTYKNLGQLRFRPSNSLTVPSTGWNFVRADLDGDGDIDAAVVSINSNVVALLENRDREASLALEVPEIYFGPVAADSTVSFHVSNEGWLPLHIDSVYSSDPAFTVTPASGVIDSLGTLPFSIRFAPSHVRFYADSITFISDGRAIPIQRLLVKGFPVQVLVDSVTPARNNAGADVSQILVRFTQDVVPSSLNDSSVIFVGRRSGIHRVSFAYDPATKTCTLTPQGKILDGEAVDITLTTGVALANGDPVLAPFSWSFFARVYKGSAMLNKEREFPLGAIPLSLCAADLDGDGFADIAVTNNGSNTLSLFRSVPGTGVVQQPDYPVGPGPRYIAASDLDGDGKTDLIVTTYNSLAILKNNGNFSFAKSVVAGNGALTGLAVADFDGDGRPDVAVSRGDESCVQIFRNMGGMKFTPMTLPFTFPYAARLYAGDLNDDGRNDLLVLRNGGNSLTVMKNDGFMHFSPVSLVNAGGVSRAASLADFDNDGRLDIAVDNMYGGCLSIFYNKGNFVFDNVPQSAVHPAPVTIEAADFDADGDLDIAESTDSSPTSTTIAVRSDSSFYPRQQFMGLIAIDLVPLDYNGDGAMDLAGINYSTGALMYLSNFISKSYHFSSTFIDFGQVDVGSSAMQSLTITNLGTEAVTIDSIRFMRHSYTARAMKNPVPARDTGSIEITFKPTAAGPDVDTMMVTVSADWTNFVLVSGTGHSLDGVTQLGGGIPKVYALEQNYPNPFNPWTRIRFAIPERSRVRLTVVNILGQELTELVNREVNAGYFEGVWNPRVSSGLYFYRIEAVSIGDPNKRFTNVKKMLLLK